MKGKHSDVYQMITDRICEKLEEGTVPWRKPWVGGGFHKPRNLVTDKEYKGVNILLLGLQGYSSKYWLTYRQARQKGGQVRKGEKSTPVIFWKWILKTEKSEATGEEVERKYPMLRYYNVFNLQQIDGLEIPDAPEPQIMDFEPIERADLIIGMYPGPPSVDHLQAKAFYDSGRDHINLPVRGLFESEEEYYSTYFHELVHSTGHEDRLARSGITDLLTFGSHEYSKEELVAEIGSCFLCNEAGILPAIVDNSSAYIQGWLQKLRNNRKWIIVASAQAQKAADYVLDRKEEGGIDE